MQYAIETFRRFELVFHSDKVYGNPFLDVELDAVFTHEDGTVITLPGFWNGENEWKVRFIAEKPGLWRYAVACSDRENDKLTDKGEMIATPCVPRSEIEKRGSIVIPEGKRYYTYGDGTPFFWLGDTHWQMPDHERLHECNYPGCTCGNQFKHLADDRVKKGFTVCQTYFSAGAQERWWKTGFSVINPQSFNDTMDVMIEYLAEKGVVTALGFGLHTGTLRAMGENPKPLFAFARYCVARYACYPLVWITAQEITDRKFNAYEVWKQVAALVDKLDGYHRPNGAHMYPMRANSEISLDLDSQPWHKQWILQAAHGGITHLQSRRFYQGYYENEKVKPYVEGECQYEDIYCNGFCGGDAARLGAWQAILSGAAGFTYGATGTWLMRWDTSGSSPYSPEPWYIGMNKPGSTEMAHLRRFFEYIGWTDLEPSFDYTFGKFEARSRVAIAHKGQDLILYYFFDLAEETEYSLLCGLKPGARYHARWFDPIHGAFIDLSDVVSPDGTAPIPPAPVKRDWLLLLTTKDLGPYETFAYPAFGKPIAVSDAKPGEKYKIASIRTSSEDPAHPAENMIDGKSDTFWQGFAQKTSQTILADLGEEKPLGYLYLETPLELARFIRYRVYGSNDQKTWGLIVERPQNQVMVGGPYPRFFEPLAGQYRYIKFFLASCDQKTPLPLTEFALFGKAE